VAPELHRLRLLTTVDIGPLGAYCSAYARWRAAEETLLREAGDELLVHTAEGKPKPNPPLKLSAAAAADMVRYAGQFAMTPAARSRTAAGIGPQPEMTASRKAETRCAPKAD
jgi:P27 family predicted phage terminase small subunit